MPKKTSPNSSKPPKSASASPLEKGKQKIDEFFPVKREKNTKDPESVAKNPSNPKKRSKCKGSDVDMVEDTGNSRTIYTEEEELGIEKADAGDSSEMIDMANDPKRKAKSNDVGWKYGFWPDLTNKDLVQCSLCGKKIRSGIKRLKQHLAGNYGDVAGCAKTTPEIMREMHQALITNKRKNIPFELDEDDEEEMQLQSTASNVVSNTFPSSGTATKRRRASLKFHKPQPKLDKIVESPVRKTPEEVVEERHWNGPIQTSLDNHLRTLQEKESVHMHIANFFYECGIPFNVANSRSFEVMIEAIGQYGPGLKPPTYHELRVPLLDKAKEKTDELKAKHKVAWKQYGCSLMLDGWIDGRGRRLINFLVNSPEGTYFMGSVDASSQWYSPQMLANLLDSKIKEIGVKNVVQVVTDRGSNFKAAMEMRPTLLWTPCAAHCLDRMLEDISKVDDFHNTITNGKRITTFVYRHERLLSALKERTKGRDVVYLAVTKSVTSFLTLQCLYKHKDVLRQLFVSEDWTKSKLSATQAGKEVCDLVLSRGFWDDVESCIRATQPLTAVFRIVYGDGVAAMPEVSSAMENAKRRIKESFEPNKPLLYKKVIGIIERRCKTQMEHKIYGAALFLNPGKYFDIREKDIDFAYKLREDFNEVLAKMVTDRALLDKISNMADSYDSARDSFAKDMVIRQRKKKSPLDWWSAFGGRTIELAMFARRIVGLCCSSWGCERNLSTFEDIHTKKINRSEHKRLSDLVYVQYNRKLTSRFQKRCELGKKFDPLALDNFDSNSEWVSDKVHVGDHLTHNDVDRAVSVSNAHDGRRIGIVYYRRKGGSSSRRELREDHDFSDDETENETSFPNDDEDVEDDYGARDACEALMGIGNDIMFDDYV